MKQYEKWMPLYVADYLADTTRLTLEQHGAYLLLIMDYWRNGAPPDDPAILARIVGASREQWSAIAPVLHGLFQHDAGLWRHKRIDEELGRAKGISKIRADIAANRHANDHAKKMQLHTPSPSHIPLPEPKPSPPERSKADARASRLPADWVLPQEWEAWAIQKRSWSIEKTRDVAESFRDFWIAKPGKDGRKLDWGATWRNWVKNERSAVGKESVAETNKKALADYLASEKLVEGERFGKT